MLFSGIFAELKIILLALAIMTSVLVQQSFRIFTIVVSFVVFAFIILSIFYGMSLGYEYNGRIIEIYIITPILVYLMSGVLKERKTELFNVLLKLHVGLLFVAGIPILNALFGFQFELGSAIFGSTVISDGKIEFRSTAQIGLIFTTPIFILHVLSSADRMQPIKLIIILLTIIVCLAGGRRALQLVCIFSFLPLLFRMNTKLVVLFLLCTIIALYSGLSNYIEPVYKTFTSGFDVKQRSAGIKLEQSSFLLNGFYDYPFFGKGLNSYANDYLRNQANKYSYELVYHAFLMQAGIIGALTFAFIVVTLVLGVYRTNNVKERAPVLMGVLAFVAMGGTNPLIYLPWFWIIVVSFARSTKLER